MHVLWSTVTLLISYMYAKTEYGAEEESHSLFGQLFVSSAAAFLFHSILSLGVAG